MAKEEQEAIPELRLAVPPEHLAEVLQLWPDLQARVSELVGFGIPEAWLEETEGCFEIARRGSRLVREPWPERWEETLAQVLASQAHLLLTLEQTRQAMEKVGRESPAIGVTLERENVSVLLVYEVLVALLRERISIGDLEAILTALLLNVRFTRDVGLLTECVRVKLSAWISQRFERAPGKLDVVTLGDDITKALVEGAKLHNEGSFLVIEPELGVKILSRIELQFQALQPRPTPVVLLVHPTVRQILSRLCERSLPDIAILSWNEVHPSCKANGLANITWSSPADDRPR